MTPGPVTKKACAPELTAQEDAVLAAFPKVATFTANETLELLSADGIALMDYEPGTAGLAGTSWTATGINNGKEAVVAQAGVETVTIEFGSDGTVSGMSGCNNYNGDFTETPPDGLTFGTLASTMKLCDDAINQIEQEYLAALAKVTTYQIDGSTLTVRDADGATQVTYTQAGAQ
jgi:heat shock protein HslJ